MKKLRKNTIKAPLSVGLMVTNRCNQSCPHCCTASKIGKELSLNEIKSLIIELKSLKVFSVSVSGGEPLVREDFFKILRLLIDSKFALRLCTNCTLINNNNVKLLGNPSRLKIRTSIDGAGEKTNDLIRGKGSFKATLKGITILRENGFDVSLRTTVSKVNLDELEQIAKLAKSLGISSLEFSALRPASMSDTKSRDLSIDKDDHETVINITKNLISNYGDFVGGNIIENYHKIENYKFLAANKTLSNKNYPKARYCPAGTDHLTIRPDGIVIPCGAIWNYSLGSIREKSLKEIWTTSERLEPFRNPEIRQINSMTECKKCELRNVCDGLCRAYSWSFYGKLDGYAKICESFKTA